MYLFIFTLLLVVFQYVNSKKVLEDYDQRLNRFMDTNEVYKDSIRNMNDREQPNIYSFNFDTNDDAMTYIENEGYVISEFIPFIKDQLMSLNIYEGAEHPLVPFASMTENKMLIDEIKLLNHKWIIASFTDGSYWGEMLLQYDITDRKELKFKVLDSVLYAK
ncbi:hydrolase [Subsaximicrobium wynnwilliamsii]|uniref:Hydrolase n=2 Tax=Subsaximicrobium wynnwilliamsii TaxID=291179 RepID=A0A5C6ZL97_9FLAO|nr:hydrolase [Subsaximicrobium wynnwilliamsii]TXD89958.1 hydrolase [Subsaximicrobium wynnwilliamsii]TXE04012.1 hydrolase [Subsaximicrobium wynnwilliamsii]